MTTRTNSQIVTTIATVCWFADISRAALLAMPTEQLVELMADHGLLIDEVIDGLEQIGRHANHQADTLAAYRKAHGHA